MFDKLKRAKSFIGRTNAPRELDLPETSHLRRTTPIDSKVIFGIKEETLRRKHIQHFVDRSVETESKRDDKELDEDELHINSQVESNDKLKQLNVQDFRSKNIWNQTRVFSNLKQEQPRKKITRTKSARESTSEYLKKYRNKFTMEEEK